METGTALTNLLQHQKLIVILWHWILTQPLRNYVFVSRHQQLLRLDFEEDFQNVECNEFAAKLEAEVKNFGA